MAQETLEEAADKYFPFAEKIGGETYTAYRGFITGAKWMEERMYSEEEVFEMLLIKHDGLTPEYVLQKFKKQSSMAQQTTTYEKLDQLLVLCNDIRDEILARRVEATDLLEMNENHFIECLSTHILDEDRISSIKKSLRIFDDTVNNKL